MNFSRIHRDGNQDRALRPSEAFDLVGDTILDVIKDGGVDTFASKLPPRACASEIAAISAPDKYLFHLTVAHRL